MRLSSIAASTVLTLAAVLAHATTPVVPARKGTPVPVAPWVSAADATAVAKVAPAHTGARPAVLVESDYPAYDPTINPELSLYLTVDANDYGMPVTMYLYWQNRVTGDKLYFNAVDGLLADGAVTDLFGHADPLAVWVPEVQRLKLLGPGASAFGAAPAQSTGRYQFVLELRDPDGRTVISRGNAMYNVVDGTVPITANITTDTTLTANNLYVLVSAIFVEDGATLTIERGTVIFGDTGSKGTLVVAQGGTIMAEGTAMQPIIMTSPAALGSRGPQDWGGVIVNGRSTLNVPGDCSAGEGDTGQYGGCGAADEADDSGTMRYVRVEFAGIEFSPDNELNGIAFQGVGSGSTFENLQVHFNQDDGIEFFGGTAQVKRVVLTASGDDSMDWTEGWRGKAQFVVAVQNGLRADHGVEADNWETDNEATPRVNSQIYNCTFIGAGDTGDQGDDGINLRRGTGSQLHNWVVYGFRETGLDVNDTATFIQANNGTLSFDHSIVAGNGSFTGKANLTSDADAAASWQGSDVWFTTTMTHNRTVDPMLASPFYHVRPDLTPLAGSPVLDANYVASPPDDGFFEPVDYLGAFGPGGDWTEGWTIWSKN